MKNKFLKAFTVLFLAVAFISKGGYELGSMISESQISVCSGDETEDTPFDDERPYRR